MFVDEIIHVHDSGGVSYRVSSHTRLRLQPLTFIGASSGSNDETETRMQIGELPSDTSEWY